MGRWLAVRVIAWGLRGGVDPGLALEILRKRFPHRDSSWRLEVIDAAQARNARKAGVRA